ncbi:MAG: tRNA (adenosine(37)-N6)-threonylcarbamoyltransferase complex ATPase subunit type 1 TsaE [Candidatus Taylorbacteria bacterium]|nr:tRNA (adenosine(37)-N6)-threonylcarbamoyltransferase complex ATPase subunit type 1 TsaE [Candidatus Taylorbacteria bacterium]
MKLISGNTYTVSESEMHAFAESFVLYVQEKYKDILSSRAVFVSLSGNLGAGKTTFSKEIAQVLRVEESVTSPTFVIQKTYVTKNSEIKRIVHIDAYRLEADRELEALQFKKTVEQMNTMVLLEWPEKVPEISKNADISLVFEVVDQNLRKITVL